MRLAFDKYQCVKCGSKINLEIHHLTYEYFGNEKEHLNTLMTLCSDCHKKIHSKK